MQHHEKLPFFSNYMSRDLKANASRLVVSVLDVEIISWGQCIFVRSTDQNELMLNHNVHFSENLQILILPIDSLLCRLACQQCHRQLFYGDTISETQHNILISFMILYSPFVVRYGCVFPNLATIDCSWQ